MTDEITYQQQRAAAQSWFQSLRPVHSPALGSDVHFTSEGFEHIIYKRERELSVNVQRK
jgi:hypothetical protein